MKRISSYNITKLEDNEVFVFGSNTQGAHGGGAARFAMNFGAVYGQAFGLQGKTFAIPTVDYTKSGKMKVSEIKKYVDKFLDFTLNHKDKKILVTEIGCGIAGFKVEEMAELFRASLEYDNVYLPKRFYDYLTSNK
ncbi:hypothetical protein Q5M87_09795 [Brachyspira innocens]|uniref:Macro domain-containing protein n=1 Tax=Brachyspira innocens TaxID=13264 RepID=A0ABT8YZD5_9SPIR|nr:hypothetical protein [Brachyspira innocens]MDO6994298.1 hypothetical protein [Brachyspira innocens]MDO7021251.1 hypothetical protein [Brachyspira innocens]